MTRETILSCLNGRQVAQQSRRVDGVAITSKVGGRLLRTAQIERRKEDERERVIREFFPNHKSAVEDSLIIADLTNAGFAVCVRSFDELDGYGRVKTLLW